MFAPPNYQNFGDMYNPGGLYNNMTPINNFAQYKHANNNKNVDHEEKIACPLIPIKKTVDPIVTGTSVLGIRYNGGVMIVADTLGSYGSLARFKSLQRIRSAGRFTAIGASGEYSDFQTLMVGLDQMIDNDFDEDDGIEKTPRQIYSYLGQVMYNKRNNMDPYYNQLVIGGFHKEKAFLGYVDLHGTSFEDETVATGYGAYIARPLLRKAYRDNLTSEEAKSILEDCMRVLYYRDARSINKLQMCNINKDGVQISDPYSVQSYWAYLEHPSRKNQIVYDPENF